MTEAVENDEANAPAEEIDDDAEIARLAGLSQLEYERAREAAAKRLSIRVTVLDEAVTAKQHESEIVQEQGHALDLGSLEPWPTPCDGSHLLSEMTTEIRRYVVMEDGDAEMPEVLA